MPPLPKIERTFVLFGEARSKSFSWFSWMTSEAIEQGAEIAVVDGGAVAGHVAEPGVVGRLRGRGCGAEPRRHRRQIGEVELAVAIETAVARHASCRPGRVD